MNKKLLSMFLLMSVLFSSCQPFDAESTPESAKKREEVVPGLPRPVFYLALAAGGVLALMSLVRANNVKVAAIFAGCSTAGLAADIHQRKKAGQESSALQPGKSDLDPSCPRPVVTKRDDHVEYAMGERVYQIRGQAKSFPLELVITGGELQSAVTLRLDGPLPEHTPQLLGFSERDDFQFYTDFFHQVELNPFMSEVYALLN